LLSLAPISIKTKMINTSEIGLVLEGGGMRGVFTCGVLDYFMSRNIEFPYAIGVSAGACNGLSFISKQQGRAKYSNVDLLAKYKYIGLKHYIKNEISWISIYCSMSFLKILYPTVIRLTSPLHHGSKW
jgi:Predicted esterase of the alpha-beta hydrolase superfamily